jgi:hypothetical protein
MNTSQQKDTIVKSASKIKNTIDHSSTHQVIKPGFNNSVTSNLSKNNKKKSASKLNTS